jgi:lysophospholipase L1-like esterase
MTRWTTLMRGVALLVAVGLFAVGCLPPSPSGSSLPSRMAAVGDSITTATDVAWCCVNPDGANPQYSWSTGYDPAVNSHYQRILALNGGRPVATLLAAQPGADSGDLAAQLSSAASFRAQYVTVLMGGNDLCYGPTDATVFRQRVEDAFNAFFASAPNTKVFVASIPNVVHLWDIEHTNLWAQIVWNLFHICPTVLGSNVTDAQRQAILSLEEQFNSILAAACEEHATCRWDDDTVFNYPFTAGDISPVDHYHPSIQGQNTLARITWQASFWGT